MRRTFTATSVFLKATVALILFANAQATDVSGAITDLLLRKVTPDLTTTIPAGVVGKGPEFGPLSEAMQIVAWNNPPQLEASGLVFYYFYGLGRDYWVVYIEEPRLPLSDYLGTNQYELVKVTSSNLERTFRVYKITSGRFKGFALVQAYIKGKPRFSIYTPQILEKIPKLLRYFR